MTESPYPILVERMTPEQARALVCPRCGWSRPATEDEIGLTDGLGPCGSAPQHCDGWLEWKYFDADRCPSCGKLGFYDQALAFCCSRRCQLQARYAADLAAQSAAREAWQRVNGPIYERIVREHDA